MQGCSAAYLASFAIFKSACDAAERSYYDVIHEMKQTSEDLRRIPVPVVSVVSAGADSPGSFMNETFSIHFINICGMFLQEIIVMFIISYEL